jgi:hypoxanthine phosphoribosyltransferase
MKKIYLDDSQIRALVSRIGREILLSDWRPHYIVGITRGGLTPAVLLSHYLGVPLHTLKVTLRDGVEEDCDHNCWMAEDALGHDGEKKNILIVDDINDSGATIAWIKGDWPSSALPQDPRWQQVWSHNVRIAALVHNLASSEPTDYAGMEINKAEDPSWIIFPWEEFWAR